MNGRNGGLEALVLVAMLDMAIDHAEYVHHMAAIADKITTLQPAKRIQNIILFRTLFGLGLKEAKDLMDAAYNRFLKANPNFEADKARADKMELAGRRVTDAAAAVAHVIHQNLSDIEAGLDGPMSQRRGAWDAISEVREALVKWDQASNHFGDVIGGRA